MPTLSRLVLAAAGGMLLTSCLTVDDELGRAHRTVETAECGHYASGLVDPAGIGFGYVVVSNDDQHLFVAVEAAGDYVINKLSLYAGGGPVPTNSSGYVYPEFFPYQQSFAEPYPVTHTFAIPLADLGVAPDSCGQLTLSLYAQIKELDGNGNVLKNHRGWAYGDIELAHGAHGTGYAFDYQLCCEPPPPEEAGCTLTQGYWKNHHEYRDNRKQRIDWPAPHDENDQLCGRSYLDILGTPPRGDAWFIVAHQYIAAILNVASGASTSEQIDQALAEAEGFLTGNCAGVPAARAPEALDAAAVLDAYNNGDIGPGHCQ